MATSFWKDAAASLPPAVRERYAAHFKAAERYEQLFDLAVETWRGTRPALAKGCRAAAQTLRAAARRLDSTARHIAARPRSR